MDDVVENCQTTFEEDGVNSQTLDDLRKVGPSVLSSASPSTWQHHTSLPSLARLKYLLLMRH